MDSEDRLFIAEDAVFRALRAWAEERGHGAMAASAYAWEVIQALKSGQTSDVRASRSEPAS